MQEETIRIHRLIEDTYAEGPGRRIAIWFQGCSIHCDGCFEKNAWNPNGGEDISIQELKQLVSKDGLDGVTILGGEPFDQAKSLLAFLQCVKEVGKNVIVFSGYLFETLSNSDSEYVRLSLKLIDLLIDGEYKKNSPDYNRPLIGSLNQRVIPLSDVGNVLAKSLEQYRDKIEVRINKNGSVIVNGMWKGKEFYEIG